MGLAYQDKTNNRNLKSWSWLIGKQAYTLLIIIAFEIVFFKGSDEMLFPQNGRKFYLSTKSRVCFAFCADPQYVGSVRL